MNKRLVIGLTLFLVMATGLFARGINRQQTAERPNFILIIADDMAWDDTTVYGHKTIRTPNLARLAREGMRFDHAFVTASSCSPSRASMFTGRYPHQTGAEQLHWPVPKEQIGFTTPLRQAGYWTAAAGKWHLGEAVKPQFDVIREGNPAGFILPVDPAVYAKLTTAEKSGCDQWVPLLRDRPKDKPFFLWLASFDPHRDYFENTIPQPHRPEDVVIPPYLPDTPELRKELALYYDEITRLDQYVGEVLDELERQRIANNTFVLFLSDNGRPFPRAKTTVYDSGIRTPLLVRWPAKVKAGTSTERLVSSVDIAPTILSLAGIKPGANFAGKDFLPLLTQPNKQVREYVYAEHNWHDYDDHGRAVRSEQFKYIRNYYTELANTPSADAVRSPSFQSLRRLRDAGQLNAAQMNVFVKPRPEEELYDVVRDPDELHNLAADPKYAAALQKLRAELQRWEKATRDGLPKVRTLDEFDRETGEPLPTRKPQHLPEPGQQSQSK